MRAIYIQFPISVSLLVIIIVLVVLTRYLSLEFESVASGDSESDYRLCLEVPLSVTGQWTIDRYDKTPPN